LIKNNADIKKENQKLKNEIAILKGEQGKPDIKPKSQNPDISSETQHKEHKKEHKKASRKNKIRAHKINKYLYKNKRHF